MSSKKRKEYSGEFKAKIALEAIKQMKTVPEIASIYEVHPVVVKRWKKQAIEGLAEVFKNKKENKEKEAQQIQEELYSQIGKLKVELDWLKKKSALIS